MSNSYSSVLYSLKILVVKKEMVLSGIFLLWVWFLPRSVRFWRSLLFMTIHCHDRYSNARYFTDYFSDFVSCTIPTCPFLERPNHPLTRLVFSWGLLILAGIYLSAVVFQAVSWPKGKHTHVSHVKLYKGRLLLLPALSPGPTILGRFRWQLTFWFLLTRSKQAFYHCRSTPANSWNKQHAFLKTTLTPDGNKWWAHDILHLCIYQLGRDRFSPICRKDFLNTFLWGHMVKEATPRREIRGTVHSNSLDSHQRA